MFESKSYSIRATFRRREKIDYFTFLHFLCLTLSLSFSLFLFLFLNPKPKALWIFPSLLPICSEYNQLGLQLLVTRYNCKTNTVYPAHQLSRHWSTIYSKGPQQLWRYHAPKSQPEHPVRSRWWSTSAAAAEAWTPAQSCSCSALAASRSEDKAATRIGINDFQMFSVEAVKDNWKSFDAKNGRGRVFESKFLLKIHGRYDPVMLMCSSYYVSLKLLYTCVCYNS